MLGAGFDTTWFQLEQAGLAPSRYLEVDFKEVRTRKCGPTFWFMFISSLSKAPPKKGGMCVFSSWADTFLHNGTGCRCRPLGCA